MSELRKPDRCPRCGAGPVLRIVGGRPTPEALDLVRRGEAMLGSCFVVPDRPDWRCRSCAHEWFDPSDPARQEADALLRRVLERAQRP